MELGILIAAVVAHFLIGYLTYAHNPRSYTHRFFLLFAVVASVWAVIQYLSLHQSSPEATLDFIRWAMAAAAIYSYSLFLVIHTFPSSTVQLSRKKLIFFTALTALVFLLSRTSLIFASIEGSGATAEPIPGPAIPLFALTSGFFILGSIVLLISRYRHSRGIQKGQLQYLIIGVIGSAFLMFFTNFVMVVLFKNTSLIILGPTYTLIFIGATAYAIVAHQLFDIRVIIKRTVIYSGLLLFALLMYSVLAFIFAGILGQENVFDPKLMSINVLAAALIAVGFDPIRHALTRATDKFLFTGSFDAQAVLAELSKKVNDSLDIREATQSLVAIIKAEMRLTHAAVITFNFDDQKIVVKDISQDGYKTSTDLHLSETNPLLKQFAHNPQIIITDMLKQECDRRDPKDPLYQSCHVLIRELDKLEVAIAVPIMVDDKAIGVVMVGEKKSGDVFTSNDAEFLTIVANQTASTIQKAKFWEEDQLKSEFVSIASHELLTPTAAIKGYLSMILDDEMGKVDAQAKKFLVKVSQSADRLATLVEDLLNVSRIESGRLKINKHNFSLVDSAKRGVDELSVNAEKKGLKLTFAAPKEDLGEVYGDPDHIYRVLINLIGNAIKYTPKGWVKCFVTRHGPHHLMFSVVDSGLGIPKESIPHLFEKFYRADRKEIDGIQGTGLGLYVSKKIVDLLGGEMWVESEQGKGSTFYFTVPRYEGQAPVMAAASQAKTASATAPDQEVVSSKEIKESSVHEDKQDDTSAVKTEVTKKQESAHAK